MPKSSKSTSVTTNLVQTNGQQAFTTSLVVAAGCDNKPHEYTIRLIRKYQTEFEQLGHLRFENGEKTGKQGQQTVYAVLNEDVALLAEVRRMNQSFLQADMSYDERKKKLVAFATKRRTKALTTF